MRVSTQTKQYLFYLLIFSTSLKSIQSSFYFRTKYLYDSKQENAFNLIGSRHQYDPNEKDANNPINRPEFTQMPSASPSNLPTNQPTSLIKVPSFIPSRSSQFSEIPTQTITTSIPTTLNMRPKSPSKSKLVNSCQLQDGLYGVTPSLESSASLNVTTVSFQYQVIYSTKRKYMDLLITRYQLSFMVEEALGNNLLKEIWSQECNDGSTLNISTRKMEQRREKDPFFSIVGYSNAPTDQIDDSTPCPKSSMTPLQETAKCMHIQGRFSLYTLALSEPELSNLIPSAQSRIRTIMESSKKSLYIHPSIILITYIDPNFKYISEATASESSSKVKQLNLVYILTPVFATALVLVFLLQYKIKNNNSLERYYIKNPKNLQDQIPYTKYDMSPIYGLNRSRRLNQDIDNDTTLNSSIADDSTLYFPDEINISSSESFHDHIDLLDDISAQGIETSYRTNSIMSPTTVSGIRIDS